MEPTWTEYALTKLREANSPTFPSLTMVWSGNSSPLRAMATPWTAGPTSGPCGPTRTICAVPKSDGKNNGPTDNNGPLDYHPALIACLARHGGIRARLTEGYAIDFDYGHGGHALDDAGILFGRVGQAVALRPERNQQGLTGPPLAHSAEEPPACQRAGGTLPELQSDHPTGVGRSWRQPARLLLLGWRYPVPLGT